MGAVLRVAVHAIRARWRGWALLALLVAVGGGAVLAAAAGAWRTSSAYPRFLHDSKASDVLVSPTGTGLGGYYRALAKLPGVAAVAAGVGLNIQPAGRGEGGSVAEVPADGQLWHRVDVPKVLAGRLPRADRAGRDRHRPERGRAAAPARGQHAPDGGPAQSAARRQTRRRPGPAG